jgi:hypothetical protein
MNLRAYTKAIVQVIVTVLAAIAAVYTDGVSTREWVNIAIIGAGALSVFTAPNVPGAAYTKSFLAAVTAGLVVLTSAVTDGVSFPELVQCVIAAAGALGVYVFKNEPELGVHD